jgi:hypothetical protein
VEHVFLPEDVRSNNLSPRSELITFIRPSEGTKGYIFIRSPNNNVFTTIQALFDKTLCPKCLNMHRPGYTPVGLPPDDLQGEHNGPPDSENGERGWITTNSSGTSWWSGAMAAYAATAATSAAACLSTPTTFTTFQSF